MYNNKNFGFGGGFGGANLQQLMKQAQKMQEDLNSAKDKINSTEFVGTSGGGMVEVTATGDKHIKSLVIKPEIVDPEDTETLQDLVIAAINDCFNKIKKMEEEEMPSIPGM